MKIKKNDDLLDDIESDIDQDWDQIADRFRQEKLAEDYKKEPVRPDFPSFERFYLTLFRILTSWDGRENIDFSALHELLHNLFSKSDISQKELLPKSFHKLWDIMCDPRKFRYDTVKCPNCGKKFNVFYEILDGGNLRGNFRRLEWGITQELDRFEYSTMACYGCGYGCKDYVNGKVVCVFEIP